MSIKFPVHMTINVCGKDFTKSLNEGDTVRCLRCGKQIKINGFTVSIEDGLPYVTCKNVICKKDEKEMVCGYKVFAPYYIEQRERDNWKHRRVRERSILI